MSYSTKPGLLNPNEEKNLNRKFNQYLNYYDIYTIYLNINPRLTEAIQLKDEVHRFYKTCTYKNAKEELENIIIAYRISNCSKLHAFANTLSHWKIEIIHSFLIIPHINKKINDGELLN